MTNGSIPSQGIAKITLSGGSVGGICTTGWDINAANVFCREMGYPGAINTSGMLRKISNYNYISTNINEIT